MSQMSYVELVSWLDQFPAGKPQALILKSVVEPGTEKGYLSNVQNFQDLSVNLIIFNEKQLVKFMYSQSSTDIQDMVTNFEVYALSELTHKSIQFLKPQFNPVFQRVLFKEVECTLSFRDGRSLRIASTDYQISFESFLEQLSNLISK